VVDDARRWRQLTVWLHVVASVGWMTLALVLFVLLSLALTADAGPTAAAATAVAHHLDVVLLAPLANTSAATGLVLSLGTPWGLAQHRWVVTKTVITLVQLYVGIFVLSGALDSAAEAGTGAPPLALVVATVAMAGAVAFQAWLSVAKPGGRTRWARDRRGRAGARLPVAARWVFVAAVAAPLVDIAVGTAVGFPLPVLSLLSVVVAAEARRRRLRDDRPAAARSA